jgi:hypothetical protein
MQTQTQKGFVQPEGSYATFDKVYTQQWPGPSESREPRQRALGETIAEKKVLQLLAWRVKGAQALVDGYLGEFRALCSSLDHISDLADDWDDAGSPGYADETIAKATGFLLSFVRAVFNSYHIRLPLPRILPGPDASIDIHWKEPDFELLLNIPPDNQNAQFYGDNKFGEEIKGVIKLDLPYPNIGLILWLRSFQ